MATRIVRPPPAAPVVLPGDVRLMNAVSLLVFVGFGLLLAAAAVQWLLRSPWFPVRTIQVEGEVARNNVNTLRANTASRIGGNWFGVDLAAARAAFEDVPWVRRAVVRRVWPDRLRVRLEEHQAVALWADDRGDRLVNRQGEVFAANVGDVEDDQLPTFAGPEGSAGQVLALHRRLQPVFARLDAQIDQITMSGRGSWRLQLDSGAVLEIGRGGEAELAARCERFVRTLAQVGARWRQPLEYADLRHTDGYAVRLRGVSTTTTPAARKH